MRAAYLAGAGLLLVGLSGCPVTDDYYLRSSDQAGQSGSATQAGSSSEAGSVSQSGGTASTSGSNQGGSNQGGSSQPSGGSGAASGSGGTGGDTLATMGGTSEAGGSPDPGQAGQPAEGGAGGAPTEPCVATTERCNGHDDDCDGFIDEMACPSGCFGFLLDGSEKHGYMFCSGQRKANWDNAKNACEDQDMHLAWLDSAAENSAVAAKLDMLGMDAEVLFGANDIAKEGDWLWVGGPLFWRGNASGVPIAGKYNNWAAATPNNGNNFEDCAVLSVASLSWGDRSCYATYPYVCEQPD